MVDQEALLRLSTEHMRGIRDTVLHHTIKICEEFARDGGTAAQCVAALTDYRDMVQSVAPAPGQQN